MLNNKALVIIILLVFSCFFTPSYGRVDVLSFDSTIYINPAVSKQQAIQALDSMLLSHPLLKPGRLTITAHPRLFYDKAFDFYIVLTLMLCFGAMRFFNPRYFQNIIRAFRSPSFGTQQLKDQMGTAVFLNLLMNIFFAASTGIYIYYLFKVFMPQRYAVYSPSILVIVLIASLMGMYGAKYVVMRFSGWAFNVKMVMNHYMYNVFLVNKIIAISLLPFIVLLAFAEPILAQPAMIASFFLVGLLFISRYIRSWQVLGGFFQYSKFHFFAYLCASELLPMAILAKLLIRGMYY